MYLGIFISVINQLDAQNFLFYNKFISSLYMFRAHVLIIKTSKLHYTASGVITPVGGRLVHRLRKDSLYLCNAILTSSWWEHVLETCRGMK